jgi:hypothetical protein
MFEPTIDEILNKDPDTKKIYLGSFAFDERPSQPTYPSCFILNTDIRTKPGQHWLAFFYNKKGFCDFFDSYAKPPSYYNLQNYIEKTSNGWNYNKIRLQGQSNLCGLYSILFLLFKSKNKIINFFQEFYSNFTKNDNNILKLIKYYSK